ncbi:hypothetical protein [Tropicimonas marinistellae]|uniref:hypothetical protein n=1 Tax=Tropicimonas marinistellae TaxID=1739787 RepID=UPI00082F402A|nr:hypothetical protein [Tropicimonas marinistellae]
MVDGIEMPPNLAEALHRQNEIDRAASGQKAPVSGFTYKGVQLESRWAVLRELEDMKRIVAAMPELMSRRLATIWCDTKAGATYTVTVKDRLWVPDLKWTISDAIVDAVGGHNGIYIDGDAPSGMDVDPYWPGDYA